MMDSQFGVIFTFTHFKFKFLLFCNKCPVIVVAWSSGLPLKDKETVEPPNHKKSQILSGLKMKMLARKVIAY